MDPISLVGLVLTLTGFCGKAVAGVNSLKEAYDDSNLSLTSLAAECATLGAALTVLEELQDEIADIQNHSGASGSLNARGKKITRRDGENDETAPRRLNATAYRNVMNRALNRRNTRNQQSRGANLDHEEQESLPNLFRAIKSLNAETVLLLLRQGEDPNQVDDSGMSPLQRCAALAGPHAAHIASSLVLHGADIDAHRAGTGMTALRVAAKSGNLFVVKALLGMGADPCVMDRLGAQAIHAAVQFGHCDIVEYLLGGSGGHEMGEHGISPTVQAAMWDENSLARDSDCTLLHFAAAGADVDAKMIELLLERGLESEAHSGRGMTALQYAISRRKADVATCLVRHGCDIVPEILRHAERGELELILDAAGSFGLDTMNSQGRTAASLAAEKGLNEALRSLLGKGASATRCDASGRSPLFWSLHIANSEAVEICLLSKPTLSLDDVSAFLRVVISSAAISRSARDRLVALLLTSPDESVRLWVQDIALENDWPEVIIRTLRVESEGDGDVEKVVKRALEMGRHGVVGALLSGKGSSITNPKDNFNLRLIWAIEAGQATIVKYLLEHGATPWGRKRHPSSPLLAACSSGNKALTKLVLQHLLLDTESSQTQGTSSALLDHMREQSLLTLVIKRGMNDLLPLFPWGLINQFNYLEKGLSLLAIVASTTGDLNTARLLLRLGVSANSRSCWSPPEPRENEGILSGDTALSVAIQLDMPDLAALLLRHGAEVDCRRRVPLAIYRRDLHGAPEVRYSETGIVEETPLISVLRCRSRNALKLVRVLLSHGADVNFMPAFFITIGDLAKRYKFELIQDPEQEVGAHWRIRRHQNTFVALTPLMLACMNGSTEVVKAVLADRRIKLSLSASFGPLHLAVISNDVTLLNTLLADGRINVDDIDAPEFRELPFSMDCFMPICLAALGGFLGPLQFLIIHGGARINVHEGNADNVCTPLCLAAYRGHVEVVQYLLGIGACLSRNDATFIAARYNDSLTAILLEELAKREAPGAKQEVLAPEPVQSQPLSPLGTPKKRTLGRKLSALLRREKLSTSLSQVALEAVQEVSDKRRHSLVVSEEQVLVPLLPEARDMMGMAEIEHQRASMLNSHNRNLR
ncbi:ankyrin repeat-containing domain protein [Dactylonectria estremocensis]|uniref:Ankyrin repeat-containing domain protein n=1 Tax=Dactylonectria estremocensis TaxID=1079267 RepID=A0A9P9EHI4_9HYPO|nr:ankyrin repeat-containing domain protein [Dactylonectria estremocensis]